MAFLPQFLLPRASCSAFNKILQGMQKGKTNQQTQSEESASESDSKKAEMVDGEIIEPGITAKGCYGKEDNTQEQMDNI